jgi:hypothetical protein
LTHSFVKASGLNPWTFDVRNWFQKTNSLSNSTCTAYDLDALREWAEEEVAVKRRLTLAGVGLYTLNAVAA